MVPSFANMLSASDPRWPQLHDEALRRAHDVEGARGSWCLVSRWRSDSSIDNNWEQHRVVVEGFGPPSRSHGADVEPRIAPQAP